MDWGSVRAEVTELIHALRFLNAAGIRDEGADVLAFTLLALYGSFGMNLPMPEWLCGTYLRKTQERIAAWEQIFKERAPELTFSPRYLKGGSNYTRPEKVEAALGFARADQRRERAPLIPKA